MNSSANIPDAPQRPPLADDASASFIDAILALKSASGADGLSLGEIADRLDERAFGLMILILALPCLVPALPGVQVIAVPILLMGLQLAVGRREIWLPARVARLRARASWIATIADFADRRMRWTERMSRPRLTALATGPAERLVGLAVSVAGLAIMLPITNTVPSLAVTLMAVGLLQRDGVFTILGGTIAAAWAGLLVALAIGLSMGMEFATRWIGS